MKRIAVVLPNWIGDVVMATPTLRALRHHFGTSDSAHIIGVMKPYVREVLEGAPWLDQHLYWDGKSRRKVVPSLALAGQLRQQNLDLILLLTNSLRVGAVAWLSGAVRRVGYVRNGRGWMLTDGLEPPRHGQQLAPVSAVDYYLRLAEVVGCSSANKQLQLYTTAADEAAADQIWRHQGLDRARAVVALCPSGAYGPAKHWPNEHFAELARQLVQSLPCQVLVMCGPAERAAAADIAARAACKYVVSLADQRTGIGVAKACLRRARVVVTTDSGPRHLAAAFGVPTVALFGPTDPRWTTNYHADEIDLRLELPCAPCGGRTCPLEHHRCMRELSVGAVRLAVENLWSGGQSRAA